MSKITGIVVVLFLATSTVLAQTKELEEEYLESQFEHGHISQQEYMTIAREWNILLAEFDGFPKLHYNVDTGRMALSQG